MVYKIFKKNNYIIVIDENNNYFEEHCSQVLVIKKYTTDTVYDIIFIRPESVPQAFYAVTFANIRDEFNAPYASAAAWETWYTTNTGCQGAAGTAATLASILATLQAQSEVEGVFVKDTGNSDKVVLQVRVWDQDSQTFINTLYFNPDGTPYTPVGPVEWVGTGGSVNSTIVGPLGNTTTCANSVAVTLCDALYTEFFAQGDLLDTINTSLDNIETDVDALLTAFNNEDFATQTTLAAVLTELQGTIDVNVTNSTIAVTQSGAWTVTANQGTNPWVVSGTVNIGTLPAISGTVALDAATLAALETTTVQQGTSPWVVSGSVSVTGEVEIINAVGNPIPVVINSPVPVINVNLDAADDQVGIYGYVNGASGSPVPLNVSATGVVQVDVLTLPAITGTVALDAATLAALESITVSGTVAATQSGVWSVSVSNFPAIQPVSATDLDIRNLNFTDDKVDASGSTVKLQDGSGNGITSTTVGADVGLDVNIIGNAPLTAVTGSRYKRILGNTAFPLLAGAVSVSVQNIGSDNVTVDTDTDTGETLDPGISVTWDASNGKFLNAFSFKGSSASSLYIVTAIYP